MAVSVTAPRARNRLPTQLKLLRSTTTFRRQLKTFFLQTAYTNNGKTDDCCSAPLSYCNERVCLSECVSVRDHIFGTTRPIFANFLHVACGRGSVLLWRRSDMLCTSGFMDDVIFAHRPRLLDVAAQLKCSAVHTQPWAWL